MGLRCSTHGSGQYRIQFDILSYNRTNLVSYYLLNFFRCSDKATSLLIFVDSGTYIALLLLAGVISSAATKLVARLQGIYAALNLL